MLTRITGAGWRERERSIRRPAAQPFALPAAETPAATSAAPAEPAALLPLLALQVEEDEARDRRARSHANATLDELSALQSALLAGHVDGGLLSRLEALAAAPAEAADPRLAEISAWISLRASVMLARLARG